MVCCAICDGPAVSDCCSCLRALCADHERLLADYAYCEVCEEAFLLMANDDKGD